MYKVNLDKVWSLPVGTGFWNKEGNGANHHCALGKIGYAAGLGSRVYHTPDFLTDKGANRQTEKIYRANDNPAKDHFGAIKLGLSFLKKNPRVQFVGLDKVNPAILDIVKALDLLPKHATIKKQTNKGTKKMGNTIRQERTRRGLTVTELARRSGVGVSTLSELESGKHNPKFDTLARVISALENA